MDSRVFFVRDYQEDGKVIVKFIKSGENDLDIFTKNVTGELYVKHLKNLLWTKQELEEDDQQKE